MGKESEAAGRAGVLGGQRGGGLRRLPLVAYIKKNNLLLIQ